MMDLTAPRPDGHFTESAKVGLSDSLTWRNITRAVERGALCNDFSPAGYFIRKNPPSSSESRLSKWVIFLEGGGGCTTPTSCNERFIEQSIRKQHTQTINGSAFVNVTQVWNEYKYEPLKVTSKLMTTLWRFSEPYRENSSQLWHIQGRDLLSVDGIENPDFHDYNHVLIPYCSSDLWLKKTNNFIKAKERDFLFQFDPDSTAKHQFTFRGAAIFQSVIEDLFAFHGLSNARQVVLGGSSAGGIGVLNHAGWLQRKLRQFSSPRCNLLVLTDSSWFINFHGIVDDQFAPEEIKELTENGETVDTCEANDPLSCITAETLISSSRLYPRDIPTLMIFSRYDLYLLATFLNQAPSSDIISTMRTVAEYAGSMNTSLHAVLHSVTSHNGVAGNLSYFVSSCFQHVYLATSTLWGDGTLLGNEDIGLSFENNQFRHIVSSGYWRSYHLQHVNSSTLNTNPVSIRDAIHAWVEASQSGGTVKFQDSCSGPRCNSQCPETIVLGELSAYWNVHLQFILMGVVMLVSSVCLLVKVGLSVYVRMVEREQNRFLKWNYCKQYEDSESVLPFCQDEDAISVACLNLRYSVTVSKSALTNAKTPIQRKRLLSVAAAIEDDEERAVEGLMRERRGWKEEEEEKEDNKEEDGGGFSCDEKAAGGGDLPMKRLDSETGQTIVGTDTKESDLASSIRQFQQLHAAQQPLPRSSWKQKIHKSNRQALNLKEKGRKKEIIKGVSTYFNPGELVAIMGPSGSGKTTFLDLLAGRRRGDSYQGEILVNGISVDKVHDWYVANTGYVLQLAAPYCEELTVRENITLAAHMRLPKSLSLNEKLDRIEKVMRETGLTCMASTPIGGNMGTGLSGGQKRRLCVALQLLSMPSLIFLDEPTSGLDASSSLELLTHLHCVASSNRAVVLTIHQPRLEIFHMFDKIMLLCQGQVAYHGIPDKAYEVFLDAHKTSSLSRRSVSLDSRNPADVIMDMLGREEERMAILDYYQKSDEPQAVENAIEEVCNGIDEEHVQQRRRTRNTAGFFNRLCGFEARATKRAKLGQISYLPVIFTAYGLLLGTVYLQTQDATSVLTGFGVFSCASALFMFPIIYSYLQRAIEIFTLEYADGVGQPGELVLQTFVRFTALALLPIIASSAVIYLLAIPHSQYSFWVFLQTTVFTISLNQTWIAMLVFIVAAKPEYAHRISPVLSAVAGFVGGFFVPPRLMPPCTPTSSSPLLAIASLYGWLYYINPNFYGFTAVSRVLLENYAVSCPYESEIECYPSSALYILSYFSLDTINPYLNVVVLLAMTLIYLVLAWAALSLKQTHFIPRLKKAILTRNKARTNDSSEKTHTKSGKPLGKLDSTPSVAKVPHSHIPTHSDPSQPLTNSIPILDSATPPHLIHHEVTITLDKDPSLSTSSDDRETSDDVFSPGLEPSLFKKVNVRSCVKRNREDSVESANDSFLQRPTLPKEKRKVSFSDEQEERSGAAGGEGEGEGAESRGGASLRRLLYRHRQTISKMLHDGENHEVWRPGMRRTRRQDSQESLDERRRSIFHRINTYRGAGSNGQSHTHSHTHGDSVGSISSDKESTDSGSCPSKKNKKKKEAPPSSSGKRGEKAGGSQPVTSGLSQADNIKRRMELWRKIEEEAMKMALEEEQEESTQRDDKSAEVASESPINSPADMKSPSDVNPATVAGSAKAKSLESVNKQHAWDHPSPIKYTETDI